MLPDRRNGGRRRAVRPVCGGRRPRSDGAGRQLVSRGGRPAEAAVDLTHHRLAAALRIFVDRCPRLTLLYLKVCCLRGRGVGTPTGPAPPAGLHRHHEPRCRGRLRQARPSADAAADPAPAADLSRTVVHPRPRRPWRSASAGVWRQCPQMRAIHMCNFPVPHAEEFRCAVWQRGGSPGGKGQCTNLYLGPPVPKGY